MIKISPNIVFGFVFLIVSMSFSAWLAYDSIIEDEIEVEDEKDAIFLKFE